MTPEIEQFIKDHEFPHAITGPINGDRVMLVCHVRELIAKHLPAAGSAEPVAILHDDGYWTWRGTPPYESSRVGWRLEVYTRPAPALPDLDAITFETPDSIKGRFQSELFWRGAFAMREAIRAALSASTKEG